MKLKTRGKLLALIISTIVLFSVVVNVIIYFEFNSFITNSILKTNANLSMQLINQKYAGDWNIQNDKLYKGTKLINDDFEIVDTIKNSANVQCTIFFKDTRITTTIVNNDKRATGTKADGKVTQKVINEGREYLGTATVLNKPYKTAYLPIKDASGSIIGMFFIGIDKQVIDSQINNVLFIVSIFTILLALVSIILVIFFSSKVIIKPITYINKYLGSLSGGDLSLDMHEKYLKKQDEFGEIARAISATQDSIKGMVIAIKESSQNIDMQSNSLESISVEIASASSSVSTAIQDVAKGTGHQTEHLVSINNITNKFGDQLETIVHVIEDVYKNADDISSLSVESNSRMDDLVKSINSVKGVFDDFSEKISTLEVKISSINEITNMINSIAGQTSMLALNAAIEAARAGEAGRGFAVVAEEVKKLAEQSKNSSESINTLISDVSNDNESMISASKKMSKELLSEMEIVNMAIKSFDEIVKEINSIIPKIQEINNSSLSVQKEKNIIIQKIEEVSSVSEQVASSSQEISASSEELNSSTEEVAIAAQNLSNMTKDMLNQVNKFKL